MRKIIYITFLFFFLTKSMAQYTVCYGTTRTFSVTNNAGNTYAWAITPAVSGVAVPTISDTDNQITVDWGSTPIGRYTLSVTETNNITCSGTAVSMDIYIIGNPTITVSPASPEICASDTVLITPAITAGTKTGISGEPASTGTDTYAWTAPAGYVGTTNTSTITAGTGGIGGNYTLKYTDTYGCIATATSTLTVNPLPSSTITATGATEFCYGGSVNLQAPSSATLPTTGGLTYQWYINGVTDATIQTIAVTGASNDYKQSDYTVKVTDSKGCTATSNGTTVTINPNPTVSISGTSDFCSNVTNLLTGTATNGTNSVATSFAYNWTKGSSTTSLGTATTYSVTETVAGSYTYNFTATDDKSCSTKVSKTVTSFAAPTLSTLSPITVCGGTVVTLNVSQTLTPGSTTYTNEWTWTGDTSGSATGNPLTITTSASATTTTNTTYTLTTTDTTYATNCSTTSSVLVTVKNIPHTTYMDGPTAICYGTSTIYSVANQTGNTYNWTITPDLPGASVPTVSDTSNEITVNWGTTEIGVYNMTVEESNGTCSGIPLSQSVFLVGNPTITVSPTSKDICFGDADITISSTITESTKTGIPGEPAPTVTPSYLWTTPSGYSSVTNTSDITTGTAGAYSVLYTDDYGCTATATSTLNVNPLPPTTITASGPTEFCYGGSVILQAPSSPTAPTTGTLNYEWFYDGISTAINNINYTTVGFPYTNAYKQNVFTVKVTDAKGCTATSAGTTVTVNPNPTISVSAGLGDEFCSNVTNLLTGIATNGTGSLATSFTYNWTKGSSPTSIGTAATYSANETVAGSYTYNFTATDNKSCSNTISKTVTSRPVPVPALSSTGTINLCAGSSIVLNDTETIPTLSNFSYSWTWLGSLTGSGTGIPLTVNSASTDTSSSTTYTLTTKDIAYPTNCAATAWVTVNVKSLPVTSAINAPQTVCYGASSNFSVTNTTGNTYAWTISPAISSIATTTATASVNWGNAPNGKYTLKVIETDGTTACPGTAVTADVYIVNKPGITISPTSGEICESDAVTIQSTITPATATSGAPTATLTPNYAWTVPAAYSGTTNTNAVTTNKGGTYSVLYTDDYGCTATASSTLIVNPLPSSTITPNGATEFCFGETVVLSAPLTPTAPTTGQLFYTWYKDGTADTSNVLDVYTVNTTSTITLKVTDEKGCSNTTASGIAVIVNPHPSVTISTSGDISGQICKGSIVTLKANPIDGATNTTPSGSSPYTGWSYSWTKSPSAVPISTDISYNVTGSTPLLTSTTSKYIVKVTDPKNCSATNYKEITTRPTPTPTLSIVAPTTICAGNTIVIEDSETLPIDSVFSYNWSWTGGLSGSANGNPFSIVSTTTDPTTTTTYTLKTIDTAYPTNCIGSASALVTVKALPETSDINEY